MIIIFSSSGSNIIIINIIIIIVATAVVNVVSLVILRRAPVCQSTVRLRRALQQAILGTVTMCVTMRCEHLRVKQL